MLLFGGQSIGGYTDQGDPPVGQACGHRRDFRDRIMSVEQGMVTLVRFQTPFGGRANSLC